MHLEFKFENEINATVWLCQKTVFAYTFDRYQNTHHVDTFDYATDSDMVKVLNKVSNMVNLAQHDDVIDLIFKHFKGCNIDYLNDGGIVIRKSDDTRLYDIGGFYEAVQHSFDDYTIKEEGGFDVFAYNLTDISGRRIATIYR